MLDLAEPVTEALYRAEGKPSLDKAGASRDGLRCGNCLRDTLTVPAGSVLTSRFGSWDDIAVGPDGSRNLCLACAWAYRSVPLRRTVTLVTATPSYTHPGAAEVRALLAGPVPPDIALIVPLAGKRIVAPRARWGHVVTDAGPLTWSVSHQRLLKVALRLRAWGFRERGLAESAPPFETLVDIDIAQHDQVRADWAAFEAARADKTLLGLYLKLSREAL